MAILILITSGVLQGCGLSGTLFAISMDPFLRQAEEEVERIQLGTVRACADDVGAAIRSLRAVIPMAAMFSRAFRFAGLAIKVSKCKLVPTAGAI